MNAQDIKRSFTKQNKVVQVIKGVSFTVQRGSCLAIVGESGSGKSTLARCLVRLLRVDSGRIVILGKDIAHLKGTQLRHHRRRIQMIFQDPFGALNPQKTVENLIGRGLTLQGVPKKEIRERSKALLKIVGLDESALNRRSHAFSGGQRQRIAIAQAVALSPAVLIADESVSALDVSIQAQILDLLEQLRKQLDITIIFITHDLRVAARISDHVGVMNQGQLVEFGRTKEIFDNPQHIYTQTLLNSAPARHWLPPKLKASLYEESPDSVMDLSSIMAP